MDASILVAEDDKNLRTILSQAITRSGAKVHTTATLSTLRRWLHEGKGDVVLLDVSLTDGDSLDALPEMRALRPDLKFVIMSAQNTFLTALRAREQGGFEYLAKPFDLRTLMSVLKTAYEAKQINARNTIPPTTSTATPKLPLVGSSEIMQDLYRKLGRIIHADLPLLLYGATGTGKSLIAKIIHEFGPRANKSLIQLHAHQNKKESLGASFEAAHGGILLIENIDEFLPSEQHEILGLIESIDDQTRLITTSHQSPAQLENNPRLRADLFHRINVLTLRTPTLRERGADIWELYAYFMADLPKESHFVLSVEAKAMLETHPWQGNITQLRALVHRLSVMYDKRLLDVSDLAALDDPEQEYTLEPTDLSLHIAACAQHYIKLDTDQADKALYAHMLMTFERALFQNVLTHVHGNQLQAAKILGINRNTLHKKLQNLDIYTLKSKS